MTIDSAEKRAARALARQEGVSYRHALAAVRARRASDRIDEVTRLVMIEAIEGCGIRHWARTTFWDGVDAATLVDLGGEEYRVDLDAVRPLVAELIEREPELDVRDVDGDVADGLVQSAVFGLILYRPLVRHRPGTARYDG